MNHPDRRAENAPRQLSIGCEIGGACLPRRGPRMGPARCRTRGAVPACPEPQRPRFRFLARALAADRRVLCPDLPGRGDSDRLADPADYNHQTYLRVLHALADSAGLRDRPVDIIGTSLGGILGMMYAATHPDAVRGLVLNDVGTVTAGEVFLKAARSIQREVRFRSLEQAVLTFKIMTASCGPLSDAQWRAVSDHMIEPDGAGGYTLRYDTRIAEQLLRDAGADLDLWHWYERIRARVLLVRGANSDVLTEENACAMAARGPRAERYTVAGTGISPCWSSKTKSTPSNTSWAESAMTPRLFALTLLSLLAFAGNSLLCRIALKQTPIDPTSFVAIRLLSGALISGWCCICSDSPATWRAAGSARWRCWPMP